MFYWNKQTFIDVKEGCPLYLLTNANWEANGTHWTTGVTKNIPGNESVFNAKGDSWLSLDEFLAAWQNKDKQQPIIREKWLHAFTHPIIAMLLNRVYVDADDPKVWRCRGKIAHLAIDKLAYCNELTTEQLMVKPNIGLYTRMKFGFACVDKVYKNTAFHNWMLDWFGGRRGHETARDMAADCELEVADFGKAAIAAQWMCWACVAFGDESMIDQSKQLIEYFTARAAVEANLAAYEKKIDFDLVTIAEITMSVRREC